jgi:mono/diheme cytochrome c family protein
MRLVVTTGCALVGLVLLGCGSDAEAPPGGAGPVWSRDVAPIVYANCVGCHHPGGIGPSSLTSYEEARLQGAAMKEQTATRTMPPWHVESSGACNTYRDARTLTDAEIATIAAWVDGGMLEGDPAEAPALPEPEKLAGVTHTLDLGVDYQPDGNVDDVYRCFVVDPDLAEDGYLTAYQVKPGNTAIVHHIVLAVPDSEEAEVMAEGLDAADDGPGYPCFGSPGIPAAGLAGWAPGTPITRYPEGTGILVPAGRKMVMQVHYYLKNGSGSDRTTVDLVLAPSVAHAAQLTPVINGVLTLPPGQEQVDASTTSQLTGSVDVHAVFPHMHKLGSSLHQEVKRGDETICLADVPDWSFDWQQLYLYDAPVRLEPGDLMTLSCSYDTRSRMTTTTFGDGSDDEMCVSFLYTTKAASPHTPECTAPTTSPSGGECVAHGRFECNPVTNEPCNTRAGEACDVYGFDGFKCYPAPNDRPICQACDETNGPWCLGGSTCLGVDGCAKYCCDDGDCGGGTCQKTMGSSPWFQQAPELGVCLGGS